MADRGGPVAEARVCADRDGGGAVRDQWRDGAGAAGRRGERVASDRAAVRVDVRAAGRLAGSDRSTK